MEINNIQKVQSPKSTEWQICLINISTSKQVLLFM